MVKIRVKAGDPPKGYKKGSDLQYEAWFNKNTREGLRGIAPDDQKIDYDYYSFYKDMRQGKTPGVDPRGDDHYLDTYKLPNHPSFSVESQNYVSPSVTPNVLSYTGNFSKSGSPMADRLLLARNKPNSVKLKVKK